MNRRDSLRTLGLGSLGLLARNLMPSYDLLRAGERDPLRKHWAWVPTDLQSPVDVWKSRFAVMRRAGISAILPEIYDGRTAYYASSHLPVGGSWLEKILPLAKDEGLETHAWMWSLPCNIEELRERHTEWFMVNRKGDSAAEKPAYVDYYRFLCPSHPEAREFLKATVLELCSYDKLDGVHLDYIRYPDVILPEALQPRYGLKQDHEYPEFDYCYCSLCRRLFEEQTGIDPLTIDDPAGNEAWRQFRYDRVTHLVNDTLVPVAHANGKLITAAVFPHWEMVRQQWPAWNLDAVLPMLYHPLYKKGVDWVKEQTENGVRSLKGRIPLYSGLLVAPLSQDELAHAIEAAIAGGAKGVVLFHGLAMTEEKWEVFRRATGA
jgi:uncharacterized lipoprotein YddW (UPF0748 family)